MGPVVSDLDHHLIVVGFRDHVGRRFDVVGVAASQRRQDGLGRLDRPVGRSDDLLERLVPDVRSQLRRLLRRIRRRR